MDNKKRPLDPRDFGAECDGATDDLLAFNAMLESIPDKESEQE